MRISLTILFLSALSIGCGSATPDEANATAGSSSTGGTGTGSGGASTSGGAAGVSGAAGATGGPAGNAGDAGSGGGDAGGSAGSGGVPGTGGSGGALPSGSGRVIGYFAAWAVYGRDYHVTDIPAQLLTHINYAFANISEEGRCVLGDPYADTDKAYPGDTWDPGAKRGSFHQLQILKQSNPHLKTLISVGGWTWSGRFSDVALTPASRATFASSCVEFIVEHGFDGIDIDWEYPGGGGLPSNAVRPEDEQNYTLLLQELRAQLDARGASDGRSYLLTIAAPAAPATYEHIQMNAIQQYVDWMNLMTYDFHGSWSTTTNFNAPLAPSSSDPSTDPIVRTQLNVQAAVQAYRSAGVVASKLVVGVPFYGRGWSGVTPQNDGLYQPFSGLPQGTWEAGVFDYHDLAANYVPNYARHWHAESKAPWLFDPSTGVMISYEDAESLGHKTAFINSEGLGGIMFWELSGDTSDSALLHAVVDGLSP